MTTLLFFENGAPGDDRLGVEGVVVPLQRIDIQDLSPPADMIVMIFVRGEPENGKGSPLEGLPPRRFPSSSSGRRIFP